MGRSKRERKQKALGSLRSKHRRFSSVYDASGASLAGEDIGAALEDVTPLNAVPETCDVANEECVSMGRPSFPHLAVAVSKLAPVRCNNRGEGFKPAFSFTALLTCFLHLLHYVGGWGRGSWSDSCISAPLDAW